MAVDLKMRVMYRVDTAQACTALQSELRTTNLEVVGSNLAGLWAYFSLSSFDSNLPLMRVTHKEVHH